MTFVHHFLEHTAQRLPNKIALSYANTDLTYQEVDQRANALADYLLSVTKPQEKVLLYLDNCIEYVTSYFGIMKAGCVVVPIDPKSSKEGFMFRAKQTEAKIVISDDRFLPHLEKFEAAQTLTYVDAQNIPKSDQSKRSVELSPTDLASILYTSGTTGDPKGVMLTHQVVVHSTENIIEKLGIKETDIDVNALPIHHSFGLGWVHCMFKVGATEILEKNFINLRRFVTTLNEKSATTFSTVPAVFSLLLNHYSKELISCKSLRYTVVNSAPMPKKTSMKLIQTLPDVSHYIYYGLTEASRSTWHLFNEGEERIEAAGKAGPRVTIKLLSEDGSEIITPKEVGEVVISGGHVVSGYFKNPEITKEVFKNGAMYTGDYGYFDSEGYLFLVGRKDHVINVAGEKVYPVEIERVIAQLQGVKECAVIGVTDDLFGHVVKAVIVKEGDITEKEIIDHAKAHLENYKIPRKVSFIDKLPKTEAGKLQRSKLT